MALVLRDIFKRLRITHADVIVILCVALVSVLIFLSATHGSGETPTVCVIEIDGEEFARYDLPSLSQDKIVEIENEYGRNTVVIDSTGAAVVYSDCADGLEVKAGRITASGQSLICLPHRLTVRLEGSHMPDGVVW